SDVIVRRDSPLNCFADLRGRSWSYNEPGSHSGYGLTRYWLVRLRGTNGYFRRGVQGGGRGGVIHPGAGRQGGALGGGQPGSAVDSQVLAVALREHPELANRLRVIDVLGPSTIQPVVASRRLSAGLRGELRDVLLQMGDDPAARPHLAQGFVERFAAVTDEDYDDIRAMLAAAEAADFLTLR